MNKILQKECSNMDGEESRLFNDNSGYWLCNEQNFGHKAWKDSG